MTDVSLDDTQAWLEEFLIMSARSVWLHIIRRIIEDCIEEDPARRTTAVQIKSNLEMYKLLSTSMQY